MVSVRKCILLMFSISSVFKVLLYPCARRARRDMLDGKWKSPEQLATGPDYRIEIKKAGCGMLSQVVSPTPARRSGKISPDACR